MAIVFSYLRTQSKRIMPPEELSISQMLSFIYSSRSLILFIDEKNFRC